MSDTAFPPTRRPRIGIPTELPDCRHLQGFGRVRPGPGAAGLARPGRRSAGRLEERRRPRPNRTLRRKQLSMRRENTRPAYFLFALIKAFAVMGPTGAGAWVMGGVRPPTGMGAAGGAGGSGAWSARGPRPRARQGPGQDAGGTAAPGAGTARGGSGAGTGGTGAGSFDAACAGGGAGADKAGWAAGTAHAADGRRGPGEEGGLPDGHGSSRGDEAGRLRQLFEFFGRTDAGPGAIAGVRGAQCGRGRRRGAARAAAADPGRPAPSQPAVRRGQPAAGRAVRRGAGGLLPDPRRAAAR
jgi:hypothetical protein